MPDYLDRALVLYQQKRYAHAVLDLRRAISDEPSDPHPHALMAICFAHLDERPDAIRAAIEGLHHEPDYVYAHYAYAFVLTRQWRLDEAAAAIGRAIALDSEDADYYCLLAQIRHFQKNYSEALKAADHGLQIQGDHVGCSNSRALAKIRLGDPGGAVGAVDRALRLEPDNARTHATKGWTLLEARDHAQAIGFFRESLRLDPTHGWAREGLLKAMKAQYPIYRIILNSIIALGRWKVVVGVFVGMLVIVLRFLVQDMQDDSAAVPWLILVIAALMMIFFAAWCADPLFNLVLRLSGDGQALLTDDQIIESNYVTGTAIFGLVALLPFVFRRHGGWLALGFGSYAVSIATSIILKRAPRLGGVMTGIFVGVFESLVFYFAALAGF